MTGDLPTALQPESLGYYGFGELGGRLAQMILPPIICLCELIGLRRSKAAERLTLIHALSAGVILKGLYNFFFVLAWAQGVWYYTVSIAVANLILILWLARLNGAKCLPTFRLESRPLLLRAAHLLFVLFTFNSVISAYNAYGAPEEIKLLESNAALRDRLNSLGTDRIVEFDDGFTSFVADVPAVAGLGLALDAEGARAIKEGRFLDMVYRRGYRVAVAHAAYAIMVRNAAEAAAAGHATPLAELRSSEFNNYILRPLPGDRSSDRLSYFAIEPRAR